MARTENQAQGKIESLLQVAGWRVQDPSNPDLNASCGVVLRNLPLARDYGVADYLLYVDGKAAGWIEVKEEGHSLKGIDSQDEKYRRGLPISLPIHTRPLPFLYQSNGTDTCFTNGFDSEPRAHKLFAFHKPATLKGWLEEGMIGSMPRDMMAEHSTEFGRRGATFQERLWINMPPLKEDGLSNGQINAITCLEQSLKKNRQRILIEMKNSSERIRTAIHFIYRLLHFAEALRVLFLVNSSNIGQKVFNSFQDYVLSYDKKVFTKTHSVQHCIHDKLDLSAGVCITTLPRMYEILTDQALSEKNGEKSPEDILETTAPMQYNRHIPIETFDVVVIDTCSSPITLHFRRVLDYFDAYVIGMGAEPDEQTIELFDGNLVLGDEIDENGGLIVISK